MCAPERSTSTAEPRLRAASGPGNSFTRTLHQISEDTISGTVVRANILVGPPRANSLAGTSPVLRRRGVRLRQVARLRTASGVGHLRGGDHPVRSENWDFRQPLRATNPKQPKKKKVVGQVFASLFCLVLLGFPRPLVPCGPRSTFVPKEGGRTPQDSTGEPHGVPPYRYQGITPGGQAPPLHGVHPGRFGEFRAYSITFRGHVTAVRLQGMKYSNHLGGPQGTTRGNPSETPTLDTTYSGATPG